MPFAVGDRVHVQDLGTGEVHDVRNGGRYGVVIKGHTLVVSEGQMVLADPPGRARRSAIHGRSADSGQRVESDDQSTRSPTHPAQPRRPPTLDLHGHTVEAAVEALVAFLNDALLSGAAEAHVIHGRSGGKVRAAVHARLKELPSIRGYGIDPRNPGVTVVRF
jgi:dsDNA-specific endonuclease/ATPase MutS2